MAPAPPRRPAAHTAERDPSQRPLSRSQRARCRLPVSSRRTRPARWRRRHSFSRPRVRLRSAPAPPQCDGEREEGSVSHAVAAAGPSPTISCVPRISMLTRLFSKSALLCALPNVDRGETLDGRVIELQRSSMYQTRADRAHFPLYAKLPQDRSDTRLSSTPLRRRFAQGSGHE
jgi:hypothetical protein